MNIVDEQSVRLKVAGKAVPVTIKKIPRDLLGLKFRWSSEAYFSLLLEEIKAMETARWNPDQKLWTIANTPRNLWNLSYLINKGTSEDPYNWYDRELIKHDYERPLFNHQKEAADFILTYHQVILAMEMRVGKTLAAIEAIERFSKEQNYPIDDNHVLWVAPRSALAGVFLEFRKWKLRGLPRMLTYEAVKKAIEIWPTGKPAPRIIVFDEIQRIKTPTAQRSIAAKYIADCARLEYDKNCLIVGMSGTPAPKSPADWWHLCEVIQPGYLREGNIHKFRARLGLFVQKESPSGGIYPEHVTWYDNELKCKTCGKLKEEGDHTPASVYDFHRFEPSKNEIANLYKRMKGLTIVKFKKDCLDLPEKIFQTINCPPTKSMQNAAKIIAAKSKRVISAMILLRELSDGFTYKEVEQGTKTCPLCYGSGKVNPDLLPKIEELPTEELIDYQEIDFEQIIENNEPGECPHCKGTRMVPKFVREIIEIDCPKIEAVKDLLDQHEEIGRIVFFAGFHGSIDRIVKTCKKEGWETIQVDGRGWDSSIWGLKSDADKLEAFASKQEQYPKIAYIGHPGSGGLGNDLSSSPTICFYSNDFVGENRMQAEDRGHSPSMNIELGCTIVDLVCLDTDLYIMKNLKEKRRLQEITLGEFRESMNELRIV